MSKKWTRILILVVAIPICAILAWRHRSICNIRGIRLPGDSRQHSAADGLAQLSQKQHQVIIPGNGNDSRESTIKHECSKSELDSSNETAFLGAGMDIASVIYPDPAELVIDQVSHFYEEGDHSIEELPLPDSPILLRIDVTRCKPKYQMKRRAVIIEHGHTGQTVAMNIHRDNVILSVSPDYNQYVSHETISTLFSGSANNGISSVSVQSSEQRTVSANNIVDTAAWDITRDTGSDNKYIHNWYSLVGFPETKVTIGKEYTIPMAIPKAVPDAFRDDSTSGTMTILKQVQFDGRRAFLCEAHGPLFGIVQDHVQPVTSKYDGKARYYVDAATGEVLWLSIDMTCTESEQTRLVGVQRVFREELYHSISE